MNPSEMKNLVEDLESEFKRLCGNPDELKEASENLLENMIDELTLELIFETHRSVKIGLQEMYEETYNEEEFVVSSSTDADKQQPVKKAQDCTCPICNRDVVPSRFAPHLENCMGMGRKRSRNASRMVANNNNNKERETAYGGLASDDEDDADWNSDKKKKKKSNNRIKKNNKNSPKKSGEYSSAEIPYMNYDNMSEEEKKNLLMKFCGVVSEHTKKICVRSVRCALHSDEKRKALRTAVMSEGEATDLNVDIEGDDDADSASLRELLQDNSNTSSPADSASNSNSSSSSKKRDKNSKSKSKNSKKERSSPISNVE